MAVTFTGDDAQAKMARAKSDLEAIRGKFALEPNPEELSAAIDEKLTQLNLPHANEQQVLDSLHKAAVTEVLSENNLAQAGRIQSTLFYMGYTDMWDASGMDPKDRLAAANKGIDNFLVKHPEYKNLPAKDLYAKITDSLWSEQPQQPQADKNRNEIGAGMGTMGGYYAGTYSEAEDLSASDVRQTAENTFGKGNISTIQAQLYMRDPAHNKRPDGVWTMQDQQELLKFVNDENAKGHVNNPIPSPVAMRWQGKPEQTDFAARVTTALTNSSIIPAQQSVQNTQHKDILVQPTRADGSSNPNDVQKMQLYLKLAGCYDGNTTPTGVWTVKDRTALQKYLDNPDHKKSSWNIFGSNPLPDRVDGLSGADFHKILDYAANDAKEKHGITPDLANKLCPNITTPEIEPAPVKPVVATPTPLATKPAGTPTPTPQASEPDVPHHVTANASIQKGGSLPDNAVAKMQAQLNLMGYYNGQINGVATDADAGLKEYAAKNKIDLHGVSIDDHKSQASHDLRVQLRADIQKSWNAFEKTNIAALQQEVDAGHKVPSSETESSVDVKQMQIVLLAAGGHLPLKGVDGIPYRETNSAYEETTDGNGHLKKPAAAPAVTPTPAATPTGTPVAKPAYDDDDPIGAGGFITPPDHYNTAPAPEPVSTTTPTATPAAGDPDFSRAGASQGGIRSPVVTGNDVGSGRSMVKDYFNGQSKSDYGSASSFFQSIGPDYIREIGNNRDFRLENMPRAGDAGVPQNLSRRFSNDQGQAFLTGPDGRFAAQYAVNGNHLDYEATYDLTDPAQQQAFLDAKHLAASQDAHPGQYIAGVTPGAQSPYPNYQPPDRGGFRLNIDLGGGGRERGRGFEPHDLPFGGRRR